MLLLECIVFCILFTIVIMPGILKNPVSVLFDYPEKIQERVKGMKEYQGKIPTSQKKWKKKICAVVVVLVLACLLLYYGNGVRTLREGFIQSYILWLAVAWYDAIVMDCIWFCHSKRVRIPGTEDMIEEYQNYWFHIGQSIKGSLKGLPVCFLIGVIIHIVSL